MAARLCCLLLLHLLLLPSLLLGQGLLPGQVCAFSRCCHAAPAPAPAAAVAGSLSPTPGAAAAGAGVLAPTAAALTAYGGPASPAASSAAALIAAAAAAGLASTSACCCHELSTGSFQKGPIACGPHEGQPCISLRPQSEMHGTALNLLLNHAWHYTCCCKQHHKPSALALNLL